MADFRDGTLKSLYEQTISGNTSDLVFKVGPGREVVNAHTLIVTEASPAFKVMLNGCWDLKRNEGGKVVQELPVDDANHFKTFVKLMYGFIGYSEDDYKELFAVQQMADKYQAAVVQQAISDFAASLASSKLTVANVVDIYQSAKEHGICRVQRAAKHYIFLNINQVWRTNSWLELDEEALVYVVAQDTLCCLNLESLKLDCIGDCCKPRCNQSNCARTNYASQNEQLIFRKVLEWIKHKKQEDPEDKGCVRVLSHVRVCQMTSNDFLQALKDAKGFLTEAQIGTIVLAKLGSEHDGVSPLLSLESGRRKFKLVECTLGFPVGNCTHANRQRFSESEGIYVCMNSHPTPPERPFPNEFPSNF